MAARILIDEDEFEVAIDEGARYRTVYVRESEEGLKARVARDPRAAASWIRTQASNGSVEAQVGWGHVLLAGHGVERDAPAALRWFQIAARSGNADALNMVGRCYERGWGTKMDPEEAVRWFRAAAAHGHAWAQYNLGKLMARGHGGPPDARGALTLLVKAARKGVPKAMNMLGRVREEGVIGVPRPASALLWYRWAAERGCFRGQFNYGRFLAASGRVEEATSFVRASLAQAPDDFQRDAKTILSRHPVEALRRIGQEMPTDLQDTEA